MRGGVSRASEVDRSHRDCGGKLTRPRNMYVYAPYIILSANRGGSKGTEEARGKEFPREPPRVYSQDSIAVTVALACANERAPG